MVLAGAPSRVVVFMSRVGHGSPVPHVYSVLFTCHAIHDFKKRTVIGQKYGLSQSDHVGKMSIKRAKFNSISLGAEFSKVGSQAISKIYFKVSAVP